MFLVSNINYLYCLEDAGFKKGDRVDALVKAINVVFVKH